MAAIRPLHAVDAPLLVRLIHGYTSAEAYRVAWNETPDVIHFELRLTRLAQPFVKRYRPLDAATMGQFRELAAAGHAFGAFAGERCIGIALCEPQQWNRSLVVQEFHIAPEFHRQGVGRTLMAAVEAHARDEGMRCIVCETQTTNVPAIRFYRALGFTLDGVDVSLYANDDLARGEVAVWLKKRIAHASADETLIFHRDE